MMPIVIVDDMEADLVLAERVLHQCKLLNPIVRIQSGNGCIAYFEEMDRHEGRVLPCLLLIDLVMPTAGVKVLKYLQEHRLAEDSVIVMLSGLQDLKAIHAGYQLGARTFLIKPINREDVMHMLAALKGICVEKADEGYIIKFESESSVRTLRARGNTEMLTDGVSITA
jgi:response regulator RpfG family c-di-GMP phosphodiesterase